MIARAIIACIFVFCWLQAEFRKLKKLFLSLFREPKRGDIWIDKNTGRETYVFETKQSHGLYVVHHSFCDARHCGDAYTAIGTFTSQYRYKDFPSE